MKIKSIFENSSIKKKSFFILTLFIVLTIVVSALFYSYQTKKTIDSEFKRVSERDINNMTEILDSYFRNIENIVNYNLSNSQFTEFIMTGKPGSILQRNDGITDKLVLYTQLNTGIRSIYAYSETTDMILTGVNETPVRFENFEDTSWLDEYKNCKRLTLYPRMYQDSFPTLITVIGKIEKDVKGAIIINISVSDLTKILGQSLKNEQTRYILGKNGEIIYENGNSNLNERIMIPSDIHTKQPFTLLENSNEIICKKSGYYDFTYMIENDMKYYHSQIKSLNINVYMIILLFLILGIFTGYEFSSKIFEPIKSLTTIIKNPTHQTVKINDKDIQFVADEITHLMLSNQKLEDELLKSMTAKKIFELAALKNQINPHFINNTLNLVHSKLTSVVGIDYPGSRLIIYMSKLLSYSIEKPDDTITIYDEINTAKIFAKILEERYNGKVNIEFEISDSVNKNTFFPKLTLNTLIENAVYHGIDAKNNNTGTIKVSLISDDKNIILTVSDNGKGMKPEKLNEIKARINNPSALTSENIGLANLANRLKLYYGTSSEMTVESIPGVNTVIKIVIPAS